MLRYAMLVGVADCFCQRTSRTRLPSRFARYPSRRFGTTARDVSSAPRLMVLLGIALECVESGIPKAPDLLENSDQLLDRLVA
jgi:hypothetical protein